MEIVHRNALLNCTSNAHVQIQMLSATSQKGIQQLDYSHSIHEVGILSSLTWETFKMTSHVSFVPYLTTWKDEQWKAVNLESHVLLASYKMSWHTRLFVKSCCSIIITSLSVILKCHAVWALYVIKCHGMQVMLFHYRNDIFITR